MGGLGVEVRVARLAVRDRRELRPFQQEEDRLRLTGSEAGDDAGSAIPAIGAPADSSSAIAASSPFSEARSRASPRRSASSRGPAKVAAVVASVKETAEAKRARSDSRTPQREDSAPRRAAGDFSQDRRVGARRRRTRRRVRRRGPGRLEGRTRARAACRPRCVCPSRELPCPGPAPHARSPGYAAAADAAIQAP